jgi:arsenate reductase
MDPYRILFVCTGNSARSILAEAIVNARCRERFVACSAGSHPRGAVHPLALAVLEQAGIPTAGLRSKAWDEFATSDVPRLDFIVTVCDAAARETCPIWPGRPITAHWGLADPAQATGTEAERLEAFLEAFRILDRRISMLARLPVAALDARELSSRLQEIGNA